MRNRTKRLGALGATALVALAVIGTSGIAQAATTTTVGGATTTTLPPQKTASGSVSNTNNCSTVINPALAPPSTGTIGVKISTDAFPQPHEGDPIKLTNTKLALNIPAGIIQTGVDDNILSNGVQVPSVVDFTITGAGTTQGSHHYSVHDTATINLGPATPQHPNGVAQPLTANLSLPDTSWTPVSKNTDVVFTEKSMTITSTIDLTQQLGIIVTATFSCKAAGTAEFMDLGGLKAVVTTTTAAPTTTATVAPTAAPTTVAAQATNTNTLPRTGSNVGLLLALAVLCISAGLFALRSTRRPRQGADTNPVS